MHPTPNIQTIRYNTATARTYDPPFGFVTKHLQFQSKTRTYTHSSHPLTIIQSQPQENDADPTGLKRGLVLFPLVTLIAIWLFSIPPEYRRARICSEQQVIDYPNSKCITIGNWVKGVSDYYRNGGGVEFDFTIDPDSR